MDLLLQPIQFIHLIIFIVFYTIGYNLSKWLIGNKMQFL